MALRLDYFSSEYSRRGVKLLVFWLMQNLFMERFEKQALETAPKKPRTWFRSVDDTFPIRSHGEEDLDRQNNIHNGKRKGREHCHSWRSLSSANRTNVWVSLYTENPHIQTDPCTRTPAITRTKRGPIKTQVDRAKRICEPHFLEDELKHLYQALQAKGYSSSDIRRATRPRKTQRREDKQPPKGKVFLPFIKGVTDRIGKMARKHKLQMVYKLTKKIQQMLCSAKDQRDPLTAAGV